MAGEKKPQGAKRQSEDNGIKIPIVSFTLSTMFRMLIVAAFAGMWSLIFEFGLYAYDSSEGYQPVYERYQSLSSTVVANNSQIFNEAEVLESLVQSVNDMIGGFQSEIDGFSANRPYGAAGPSTPLDQVYSVMEDGLRWFYKASPELLMVWLFATLNWTIKVLTIVAMSVPALLIIVVGFVDGLVARKIAMFQGVRDVIDRIEYWIFTLRTSFYLLFFAYLALPVAFGAYFFMLPASVMFAIILRQVVANYKKYT
ncbi:hypothetical protein [Vibrio barjaei]|uniref:hypothetical protein n=1 Tax=Vibrio barjaei TaxID=1676683 RepID=UPI002285201E|nr:hypothetical protein [Vibrio barjaei]MCY9872364.1 hypothetical protein [Vibrio barjaei]